MMRILFTIYLGCVSALALAQGGDSLEVVEAERATLQAESRKAEALCYERFAVNACLSEVATQRRAQVAVLRKRELALRDAQRTQRSSEQRLRLAEKQANQAQRSLAAQEKQSISPAEPKLIPVPAKMAPPAEGRPSPTTTPEQATANRAVFETKQREAARRKAELEKRLLERKDRAQALPTLP